MFTGKHGKHCDFRIFEILCHWILIWNLFLRKDFDFWFQITFCVRILDFDLDFTPTQHLSYSTYPCWGCSLVFTSLENMESHRILMDSHWLPWYPRDIFCKECRIGPNFPVNTVLTRHWHAPPIRCFYSLTLCALQIVFTITITITINDYDVDYCKKNSNALVRLYFKNKNSWMTVQK